MSNQPWCVTRAGAPRLATLYAIVLIGVGATTACAKSASPDAHSTDAARSGDVASSGVAGPAAASAAAADSMPVFRIIEGAKGAPTAYTPGVLDIPAGVPVAVEITDNVGGCGLITVFPGLGLDGGEARARVPVGQTRRVVIRAPKPGRYRYHCSENMFFGEIVAHRDG